MLWFPSATCQNFVCSHYIKGLVNGGEGLLNARYCAKCFKQMIGINPYNNPIKYILILSLFYKWAKWVTEKSGTLYKISSNRATQMKDCI